jgi:hypothetical protein
MGLNTLNSGLLNRISQHSALTLVTANGPDYYQPLLYDRGTGNVNFRPEMRSATSILATQGIPIPLRKHEWQKAAEGLVPSRSTSNTLTWWARIPSVLIMKNVFRYICSTSGRDLAEFALASPYDVLRKQAARVGRSKQKTHSTIANR